MHATKRCFANFSGMRAGPQARAQHSMIHDSQAAVVEWPSGFSYDRAACLTAHKHCGLGILLARFLPQRLKTMRPVSSGKQGRTEALWDG